MGGGGGVGYFDPIHDRGPLLNATRYLSKSLAPESSQRAGRKVSGDGNMVEFRWIVGASIDTTVWWLLGLCYYGGGGIGVTDSARDGLILDCHARSWDYAR